jgi:AraC family chitin signaling transcriptional activator
MQIVSEKYSDPTFSADDMASSLLMSKSTFARKLKLITEKTPTEILTEYRLGVARTLLSSSNRTVSEVAYAVGFNDPYYFSKKFRNFYGYSPSQQNGFGLK